MKALTLSQPWATAIALGMKKIETRKWHPQDNPGVVIIASSNTKMTANQYDIAEGFFGDEVAFPRRSLLAVAQVVGFERTEAIAHKLHDEERDLGDYSPGRWAWRLGKVIKLDPIELYPVRPNPGAKKRLPGALNLWDLPQVFEQGVLSQIGGRPAFERLAAEAVGWG